VSFAHSTAPLTIPRFETRLAWAPSLDGHASRKGSKRVQFGEPAEIGVSNLWFAGDPNSILELVVSQAVCLNTVSASLFSRPIRFRSAAQHHAIFAVLRSARLRSLLVIAEPDKITTVTQTVEVLVLDLLEWLSSHDRSYEETMDAWRTSCPKLPVWEDANDHGLICIENKNGRSSVRVTPTGLDLLGKFRPGRVL
jgi:D-3-phosphoglycerate dehydrogenase